MSEKASEEPLHLTQNDGSGYFPGLPGMVLKGRYEVLVKLGWGKASSTWLVRDNGAYPENFFAVKILTAAVSELHFSGKVKELEILKAITTPTSVIENPPSLSPLGLNVVTLKDYFEEVSPHGKHLCLVLPPLGPSIAAFRQSCPARRFDLWTIKNIIESIRVALDYVNRLGIVHHDVGCGNIFVDLYNEYSIPELLDEMITKEVAELTIDGGNYKILQSQPLTQWCTWNDDGVAHTYDTFCLAGFIAARWSGSTCDISKHWPSLFAHSAPEVILGGTVTPKADIWSFGCMVYELVTGETYFSLEGLQENSIFQNLLAQMIAYTGERFSPGLITCFTRAKEYLTVTGELLCELNVPQQSVLERLTKLDLPELGEQDRIDAAELIESCLRLDPTQRPTAQELLWEPFFRHPRR